MFEKRAEPRLLLINAARLPFLPALFSIDPGDGVDLLPNLMGATRW
ncbi:MULTISPECIES: hypothetical protein [unclassified Mesorhizobium]